MEPVGGTDIWGDGENINSTQTNTRPKEYAAPEASGWYEANPTPQIMDYFLEEKDKDGNFEAANISRLPKFNVNVTGYMVQADNVSYEEAVKELTALVQK